MKRAITRLALLIPLTIGCAVPERGAAPEPDAPETPTDTAQALDVKSPDSSSGGTSDTDDPDSIPQEEDGEEGGEDTFVPPPLGFAGEVHQVLVQNCTSAGCHGSGAGGYSIVGNAQADYAATLNHVVPGDAQASRLIRKGANISSHGGGPALVSGTPEFDLVSTWINEGANP